MAAATATVVKCWSDGTFAHMAAVVAEGGKVGNVEYVGSTLLVTAAGAAKSTAQLQADLTADIAAQRAAQRAAPGTLPISGTVTV